MADGVKISDREYGELAQYRNLGSVSEVQSKINKLERDNAKQRDEIRDRDEKLKLLPAEGAVVLVGDDAKAWPEYQALGKPAEVKAKLAEGDALKVKDEARTKSDAQKAAAEAAGFDADVLAGLRGAEALTYEVRTEKVLNEKGERVDAKVAYATPAGEGAKAARLDDEFVKATWGERFVPVLKKQDSSAPPLRTAETRWIPQSEGDRRSTTTTTDQEVRAAKSSGVAAAL